MSASFYDLLKYAKTGIAAPDMTAYDKMRAVAMAGGKVKTLTGVPPLSFTGNGKPLISWSMKGNGQQQGTPTPDSPIMPQGTGERSAQLIPYPFYSSDGEYAGVQFTTGNGRIIANGTLTSGLLYYLWRPAKFPAGTYTMSVKGKHSGATIYFRDTTHNVSVAYIYGSQEGDRSVTFTVAEEISAMVYVNAGSGTLDFDCTIMLNTGSTALPYEPYGWAEKITCAGQTVPVYLGQVSTVRRVKKLVLTGEEQYWWSATYWNNSYAYYSTISTTLPQPISDIGICSHFQRRDGQTLSYGEFNIQFTPANNRLVIGFGKAWFATLDDFKAYLAQQYAAGTPVTVWYVLATPETAIVNEPLCKIGDYADELHSTDAGVTIPTVRGSNTLTVDTTLQPSSMTITYKS